MKTIFIILFFVSAIGISQGRYITRTGAINFEASVPSFEEVAAKNSAVTAIINTENGEIAVLALINGFRFKNALMEEHFNENYAESNKYPKAHFQGMIENYSIESGNTDYILHGSLTFHGVTKSVESIPITVNKIGDKIILKGEFKTKASDYKIEIPKIVRNKVSDEVSISFEFSLQKK